MNKTTENFFKVYNNWDPTIPPPPVIFRLIYDQKTGKATALTSQETEQIHIVITREQANRYPHQDPRAYVVDGKLEWKTKKLNITEQPNKLAVNEHADVAIITDYNMLIIDNNGNQRWTYE